MFREITLIDYARPLKERAKARKGGGPYRWTPSKPGKGRSFYMASEGFAMASHGSALDLRIELANDHLPNSRLSMTNGYYPDLDMSDTLQPIIARLPRGRGFLAGWTMGAGMCASLDVTIWDDEGQAAHAAHDMAESDAEKSREAQEDEADAEEFDRECFEAAPTS